MERRGVGIPGGGGDEDGGSWAARHAATSRGKIANKNGNIPLPFLAVFATHLAVFAAHNTKRQVARSRHTA
jgi:hypothetical protein